MKLEEEIWDIGYIHDVKAGWLKPLKYVGDLDIMSRVYHVTEGVWVWVPTE